MYKGSNLWFPEKLRENKIYNIITFPFRMIFEISFFFKEIFQKVEDKFQTNTSSKTYQSTLLLLADLIFILMTLIPIIIFMQIVLLHEGLGWHFFLGIYDFAAFGFFMLLFLLFLVVLLVKNETNRSRTFRKKVKKIVRRRIAQIGIAIGFIYMAVEYPQYPKVGNVYKEEAMIKWNLNNIAQNLPSLESNGIAEDFYTEITSTDYVSDNASFNIIYGGGETLETVKNYYKNLNPRFTLNKPNENSINGDITGAIFTKESELKNSFQSSVGEGANLLGYVSYTGIKDNNPIFFNTLTSSYSCYNLKYKLTFANGEKDQGERSLCDWKDAATIKITPNSQLASKEGRSKIEKIEFWVVGDQKDKEENHIPKINELSVSTGSFNIESNFCIEGNMTINQSKYSKITIKDKAMDGYFISKVGNIMDGKCIDQDMWK